MCILILIYIKDINIKTYVNMYIYYMNVHTIFYPDEASETSRQILC